MKAFFFGRPWLCSGGFLSLLVVCSMTVHPFGSVKSPEQRGASASDLQMPRQIAAGLKRSCMDCHSNQTEWPWYSYVAPASWLIERDVRRGRDHMNFSEWDQYTFKQQEKLFADLASAVKNDEMPPPQYTLIHPHAKLSPADADFLYNWARRERRRLKALMQLAPASAR